MLVVLGLVFAPVPGFQMPTVSADPELFTPRKRSSLPSLFASMPTKTAVLKPLGLVSAPRRMRKARVPSVKEGVLPSPNIV